MELAFTVGIVVITFLIMSGVTLTVSRRNNRELKYLRNKVLKLEKLLMYGKEQREIEEKARQEASKKG